MWFVWIQRRWVTWILRQPVWILRRFTWTRWWFTRILLRFTSIQLRRPGKILSSSAKTLQRLRPPRTRRNVIQPIQKPTEPDRRRGLSYSVLRLFTGLATAALMACQLTVTRLISSAPAPDATKTQTDIDMR